MVLAVLLATACSAGGGQVPAGSAPPSRAPAVDVSIGQYRSDEARRTLQIRVTNREDRPVVVESVQLLAPALETLPPVPAETTLRPGGVVDVRSGYGAVRCGEPSANQAAQARVLARVRTETGAAQEVVVPVGRSEALERISTRECRQQRLAALLSVRLRPDWTRGTAGDGPVLRAALELHRLGGQELRLTGMQGSVFYALRPVPDPGGRASLPLRLDPASATVTVPVEIRAGRCDAHAVSELDKRHFVFSVRIRVDDGPEQPLLFQQDEAIQDRLRAELPFLCGD